MYNDLNGGCSLQDFFKKRSSNLDLTRLIEDYRVQLLDKCRNIFVYKNVPESLDVDELERMLILTGFCVVGKVGEDLRAIPWGYLYGVDPYNDQFPNAGYSNPIWGSGDYVVGKNCVVVRNTKSYYDFTNSIDKYATILADIDISLDMTIVNTRMPFAMSAMNAAQKKSLEEFYDRLRNGKYAIFEGENLVEEFRTFQLEHPTNQNLTNLITTKMNTIRMFLKEIGVSMSKDKTQAVLSDEVETDDQHLMVNVDVLLKSREKGIAEINKIFGTNIEVSLNPVFDHQKISNEPLVKEGDINE